jgi:myo-inositol-1-phosphate synthase
MPEARVAIVGVGNCASALVQGVHYYSTAEEGHDIPGLLNVKLGGYHVSDIKFVAAFDVDNKKVGKDLSEAIFSSGNNTPKFCEVPSLGVKVSRGPTLDGLGKYLQQVIETEKRDSASEAVTDVLRDSAADIVVNYLPVGSEQATKWYAERAIEAGCSFINNMPVFIASDPTWQEKFASAGLAVAGDDVMSQIGATVLHKTIARLLVERGVKIDETYQLNVGGDTDFLNMLEQSRLKSKRESKTSAVKSLIPYQVPIRIGPSDYIPFLQNKKICYIWVKGRYFGNTPFSIDVKLDVVDAPNSGGVVIDAIRCTKLAMDRRVSGVLTSISAYAFKRPPVQAPYEVAKQWVREFVEGRRER